jgi:hypothetical protein
MYQVSEVTDTSMARLRSIGSVVPACAVPACAVPAHGLTSRHAFAARPWQGSLIATMPSLGEGHGAGLKSILANGLRRLKEPST